MQDEGKDFVFYGRLEECLVHLGKRLSKVAPPKSKSASLIRQPMVDFIGVHEQTPVRWLYHRNLPKGHIYYKLACFLELNGYGVIEIRSLTGARQTLAELVGYGVLDADQASRDLGYQSVSTLYFTLRNGNQMSDDREQALWNLVKKYREDLERAKARANKLFLLKIDKASDRMKGRKQEEVEAPQPVQEQPVEIPTSAKPAEELTYLQVVGFNLIESLAVVLDAGAFENLPQDHIDSLRTTQRGRTVIRMTEHLVRLSARIVTQNEMKE